ncbi:MAG: O-antigen ligase family protein [Clostridia bacterium]|nr:O-antigen ligase family protein [Clostridia bacterium]
MSKKRKLEKPTNLYIIPIAFVITVVPLIVFLKVFTLLPIEAKNWYGQPTYTDFFNYYKSQWLLAGSVIAVLAFLINGLTKGFNIKKSAIYIPLSIYAVTIVLSTMLSKYSTIALRGFVARYEGMITLLCYLALFFVTYNLVKFESQIKFILGAFLVSASIIGIVGLFQFLGLDLYRTAFGKSLILPAEYRLLADTISFRFEKSVVYSTFSNSNYIGSYMAMAIPIAFFFFVMAKKLYLKIGTGLLTIILLINLFGSRSRAGLVALGVSLLFMLIIFRKEIFKRKVLFIVGLIAVVVTFFAMNAVLKGKLTERVFSEFTQASQNEKDFFDLKDIKFGNQSVSIISSTETLTIKNIDSRLYFYGPDDKALDYNMSDNNGAKTIAFTDPVYKNYTITLNGDIIDVYQKQTQFKLRAGSDTFKLLGLNGDETNSVKKPETLGFSGQERLGSARGYIWSRTLPMLMHSLLIGYGPDTYPIVFPQDDYIGKIRAYGTAQMIVDKPHDIYLQIGVSTGIVSLAMVLILWGLYIIQSVGLFIKIYEKSALNYLGIAVFIAIAGYLAAGFFNDSVVGIAPIFWMMLGLGFVCNRICQRINLT